MSPPSPKIFPRRHGRRRGTSHSRSDEVTRVRQHGLLRNGLKIRWPKGRPGSTPGEGATKLLSLM